MSNVTNCHYLQVTDSTPKKKNGGGGWKAKFKKKKDFLKIHPIYVENVVYFDDILI